MEIQLKIHPSADRKFLSHPLVGELPTIVLYSVNRKWTPAHCHHPSRPQHLNISHPLSPGMSPHLPHLQHPHRPLIHFHSLTIHPFQPTLLSIIVSRLSWDIRFRLLIIYFSNLTIIPLLSYQAYHVTPHLYSINHLIQKVTCSHGTPWNVVEYLVTCMTHLYVLKSVLQPHVYCTSSNI